MPGRQVGKQAWHATYTFYYGKVRLTNTFKKTWQTILSPRKLVRLFANSAKA